MKKIDGNYKLPLISIMNDDFALFDNIESIIKNAFNYHEIMCLDCKGNGVEIIDNFEFPKIITIEFHLTEMDNINLLIKLYTKPLYQYIYNKNLCYSTFGKFKRLIQLIIKI